MHQPFQKSIALVIAMLVIAVAKPAGAGGLEYPDNGAEAAGRGAAFTAKADDGTALIYNVAGFARQRGWRLTMGSNTAFHSATFQRSGVYPDDPKDKLTPWGGQKFPLVKSSGPPTPIPHLVLSTDLGTDRLTVGMGVYAPSVITGRVFPLGVEGKPSPGRYDAIKGGGIILYPSLFAAFRVTEWLDLGVAANFVLASLEAMSMSSADLAKAICPNQEYQPCDARQSVATTGGAVAFSLGAMFRPVSSFQFGLQFRTPFKLETEGTVTASSPAVQPGNIPPGQAFLTQPFPWVLRAGARYIGMDGKREAWDLEADMTYESWGSALGDGTQVYIPKLSLFENIRSTIKMGFQDTISVRVGGAYNIPISQTDTISIRAGGFHDTAATKPENTRLLFDTVAKTGLTAGFGLKHGPVGLSLSVGKIFHETREVENGEVRPINGSQGGKPLNSEGQQYAPVNNGTYTASTWTVGFGVTIQFDEAFGSKRIPAYGADYEVTSKPWENEKAPTDAKPTEEEEAKKKQNDEWSTFAENSPTEKTEKREKTEKTEKTEKIEKAEKVETAATEPAPPPAPEPKKKPAKRKKPRTAPTTKTTSPAVIRTSAR